MIGSLSGEITYYTPSYILLEVGGVGYKVQVSKEILAQVQNVGQKLKVYTYTYVREDALDLYGFGSPQDLDLFESLLTVSGIGPKTAMGVFSTGSRSEIISAILNANTDFFTSVPRLGKKNAQKIIIELKSKFGKAKDLDLTMEEGKDAQEVVMALKSFGFTSKESYDAIQQLTDKNLTVAQKVKAALKYLGK